MGFHLVTVIWAATLVLTATLVCFRGIYHSGIFSLISLDESPGMKFLYENVSEMVWATVGAIGTLLVLYLVVLFRRLKTDRSSQWLVGLSASYLALFAHLHWYTKPVEGLETADVAWLEWILALHMPFISLLLMQVFGRRIRESGREEPQGLC